MTAIIFGIGLLGILVIVVILVFKPYDYGANAIQFGKIGKSNDDSGVTSNTKWRSVRVRPGLIACDRVASLTGPVFLAGEAPELPLKNCSERDCRCHYVFLDDRRSGIDRRDDLGRLGEFLSSSARDRRLSPGRRIGDLAAI